MEEGDIRLDIILTLKILKQVLTFFKTHVQSLLSSLCYKQNFFLEKNMNKVHLEINILLSDWILLCLLDIHFWKLDSFFPWYWEEKMVVATFTCLILSYTNKRLSKVSIFWCKQHVAHLHGVVYVMLLSPHCVINKDSKKLKCCLLLSAERYK